MNGYKRASSLRVNAFRFLILMGLSLLGCPPPGEGAKAEAGYRRAHPVIEALDRYQKERGSYPESLDQLPAEWLPQAERGTPAPYGLVYKNHGERYELTFSYTGPGVNHCTYDSASREAKRWRCHGYY